MCLNFFAKLATIIWWPFWSNIRFRKAIRNDVALLDTRDVVKTIEDIKNLAIRIYNNFSYNNDGVDQLWDAITPPPQNYLSYSQGILSDDCDGFHSALYHCLHRSGIECYLLAVAGIGSGHCVLIFKLNGLWRVVDYTTVYEPYALIENAINAYNEIYKEKYDYKRTFIYNALIKYNYSKGKFKGITLEKFNALK